MTELARISTQQRVETTRASCTGPDVTVYAAFPDPLTPAMTSGAACGAGGDSPFVGVPFTLCPADWVTGARVRRWLGLGLDRSANATPRPARAQAVKAAAPMPTALVPTEGRRTRCRLGGERSSSAFFRGTNGAAPAGTDGDGTAEAAAPEFVSWTRRKAWRYRGVNRAFRLRQPARARIASVATPKYTATTAESMAFGEPRSGDRGSTRRQPRRSRPSPVRGYDDDRPAGSVDLGFPAFGGLVLGGDGNI